MDAHTPLSTVLHVVKERAATEAAITREADESVAALKQAFGGEFPDPIPFTPDHVRALVRSAFLAGVVWQMDRATARVVA